ncbi:trypsin 3A1 [Drosophila takahashii]|uniref:trypsin 3A1 n=1 Tax=Drosophila takahashii TaxID=29030 RepID=UPI001CF8501B|nr:trypsin 3A1 [Drosophila takahashii]
MQYQIQLAIMNRLVFPLLLVALPRIIFGDPEPQSRIIGGYYVDIEDAPYQAEVLIDGTAICSGAIIKPRFILTAASCVSEYSSVQVRVDTNSRDYDDTGTLVPVCDIITHPGYNYWRFDNNLALLELCAPLNFSETVEPISLAEELPEDYSWCVVAGWGSTSWWGSWWDRCLGSLPDYLQMVWVSVYNREQCAADRGVWLGLWDNGISALTLCTQYGAGGCSYDTGAPLVRNGLLVGILSEGGCSTKPDVYASVIWFQNWIDDNTEDDDTTTSSSSVATRSSAGTTSSSSSSSTPTPSSSAKTTSSTTTTSSSSTETTSSSSSTTLTSSSNTETTSSSSSSTETPSSISRTTPTSSSSTETTSSSTSISTPSSSTETTSSSTSISTPSSSIKTTSSSTSISTPSYGHNLP